MAAAVVTVMLVVWWCVRLLLSSASVSLFAFSCPATPSTDYPSDFVHAIHFSTVIAVVLIFNNFELPNVAIYCFATPVCVRVPAALNEFFNNFCFSASTVITAIFTPDNWK